VIDSRTAEDGVAIRRRRECLACNRRFTTYERIEEMPFMVVKRSGHREPFDRGKIVAGVRAASKNRPLSAQVIDQMGAEIEEGLRLEGTEVSSEQVGIAVLAVLRSTDEVAYLRFASVYKGFTGARDFQREVGLLQKTTSPKVAPAPQSEPGGEVLPPGP
jgi:transcriptional repressor NrdR